MYLLYFSLHIYVQPPQRRVSFRIAIMFKNHIYRYRYQIASKTDRDIPHMTGTMKDRCYSRTFKNELNIEFRGPLKQRRCRISQKELIPLWIFYHILKAAHYRIFFSRSAGIFGL